MAIKRILGVLALLALSVPVLPAGAQEPAGTSCTADYLVALAPGLGSEPASGTFHSGGETGTIDCQGRRGTLGGDGRYGTSGPVSCTSGGEGWGVLSFTLADGTVKDTFTMDFGGLSGGFVSGRFEGERLSGTFTFTPTEGDCLHNPVTRGRVHIEGNLRD